MVGADPSEWSQTVWQCNFVVMIIPQGYGKRKSDNDRHQSNHPRVLTRDITTRDGAKAETQPHIFEELS